MTTESSRPKLSQPLSDADMNKQLMKTMKKMQAEMDSLRLENTTLRKERTAERSRSTNRPRKTLLSVVRSLDMNDGEDDTPPEENAENEEPPLENEEEDDERRDDNWDEHHVDLERRRSRHRSSRSHDKVPESVKEELDAFREMLQRIPGVPKPLEKATLTRYTD